jgi:hypothetical protein
LFDPKEESSRRVRSRLSGNAFDSITSFTCPGSSSRLFDRDILESSNNLNFNVTDGKEPSNVAAVNITPSQAITGISLENCDITNEHKNNLNIYKSKEYLYTGIDLVSTVKHVCLYLMAYIVATLVSQ